MRLCVLSFNVNFQSGLEFHCEVVIPDNDALKPALYQGLVEGLQVCGLLVDKILQFIDAGNLCVSGGSVNRTFLSLFPEFEDLISYLIINTLFPKATRLPKSQINGVRIRTSSSLRPNNSSK